MASLVQSTTFVIGSTVQNKTFTPATIPMSVVIPQATLVTPSGLDATGATDITGALQSLLNSTPDGGTVDFGNGLYRLDGTITLNTRNNLTLKNGNFFTNFVDPAGTITAQDYYASHDAGTWPPTNPYRQRIAINFNGCTNCTIDNMHWRGANPVENLYGGVPPQGQVALGRDAYQAPLEAQHFMSFQGGTGFLIQNCTCYDMFGDFLSLQPLTSGGGGPGPPCTFVTIQDCLIYNSGRMGVSFVHCEDVIIRRCTFYNMRRTTIDIEPTVAAEWCKRIEVDSISYGNHVNGFAVISCYSVTNTINDINIHDCYNNHLGDNFVAKSTGLPFYDGADGAVFAFVANGQWTNGKYEPKLNYTLRNNVCTVAPSTTSGGHYQSDIALRYTENIILENNVMAAVSTDASDTAVHMFNCRNVTDLGGNRTTPVDHGIDADYTMLPGVDNTDSPTDTTVTFYRPTLVTNVRNALNQPFAVSSIWNTAIGSSATLTAATLPLAQQTAPEATYFVNTLNTDPVINVYAAQPSGAGYCGSAADTKWYAYKDPYSFHPAVAFCTTDINGFGNRNVRPTAGNPLAVPPVPQSVIDGWPVQGNGERFLNATGRHNNPDSQQVFYSAPSTDFDLSHITPSDYWQGGPTAWYIGMGVQVLNGLTRKGGWICSTFTGVLDHLGDNTTYYLDDIVFPNSRTLLTFTKWTPTLTGGVVGTTSFNSQLIPDKDPINSPTGNKNHLTVLQPNNTTLNQYSHAARCFTSGDLYGNATTATTITGDGLTGARTSGLCSLGGALTYADVQSLVNIRHALAVSLPPALLTPANSGFRWPATQAPGFGSFTGADTNVALGALLAIPSSTSLGSLSLSSTLGAKLFFALQNYGAYVVDVASTGYEFAMRFDAHQWVSENIGDISTSGTVNADINKLIHACRVVTNNTLGTIGGGGTPLQPAADPLG